MRIEPKIWGTFRIQQRSRQEETNEKQENVENLIEAPLSLEAAPRGESGETAGKVVVGRLTGQQ